MCVCVCCFTAVDMSPEMGLNVKRMPLNSKKHVSVSIQKLHALNNVCCACMTLTRSVEEIFDLEAEQGGRNARFTVYLSCYCLQPKHIVVQRLWQSLSWVWMKDEEIKRKKKEVKMGKEKGREQDRQRNIIQYIRNI